MATVIRTDEQLETEVGKLASGLQAGVPQVTPVLQTTPTDTIQGTQGTLLETSPSATTTAASPANITPTPPTLTAGLGQISQLATNVPSVGTMGAAQITDPKGVISNIPQGTVSEESMVTMPTEELDQKATTQYQLSLS